MDATVFRTRPRSRSTRLSQRPRVFVGRYAITSHYIVVCTHISWWSVTGYHITDTNNLCEGLYVFSVGRSDVSKSCNSRGSGKVYTASKQVSIIVITMRSLVCIVCGECVIDWCIKHTHRPSSTKLTAVAWPPPTFDSAAEGRIVFVILKRKHLRCLFTTRLCMTAYLYYILYSRRVHPGCIKVTCSCVLLYVKPSTPSKLRTTHDSFVEIRFCFLDTINRRLKCRHRVDEKYNY